MNKGKYQRATDKTRNKIQTAFAELLAERGAVRNISVTELANRAEITRGTFYNYYDNINEVGAELQSEIEKRLFSEYDGLDTIEDIERYIDDVFYFLGKQEAIYREFISSDASTDFLKQLENEMSQSVLLAMHKIGINDEDTDLDLLFLTNGAIAIGRRYYQGEIDLTLDDIRNYLKAKLRQLSMRQL